MEKIKMNDKFLWLEIISPKGKILEDKIFALTSRNELGVFDILPGHQNFLTIIFDEIKVWKDRKNFKIYKIDLGILKCEADTLKVFLKINQLANI